MPDTLDVQSVVFREDLYPRLKGDPATVQRYAEDIEVLPPIEVNQHNELIDGWHRWTAHRKVQATAISVTVTPTESDAHLLELAIERNAAHGLQLSVQDKEAMARKIYTATPVKDRSAAKTRLQKLLSVGDRTVRGWFQDIDRQATEDRNRRIFDLWLACYTEQEIADRVGVDQATVARFMQNGNVADMHKTQRLAADYMDDFEVPIYNVWSWSKLDDGQHGHFGNSDQRIVDNLLYLYTEPFTIVVDPFAGGGSTIDIAKKRSRRYWVSDRLPIVEREADIRQADATAIPGPYHWGGVGLVYLDPPYWKQAEGQYSSDPYDLANMSLEDFTTKLVSIIKGYARKLKPGAAIALLIQPTQWRAPNRQWTDHIADVLCATQHLTLDIRVQCPYSTQQATPQMVEWAKANKKLLGLSRELIIWRV